MSFHKHVSGRGTSRVSPVSQVSPLLEDLAAPFTSLRSYPCSAKAVTRFESPRGGCPRITSAPPVNPSPVPRAFLVRFLRLHRLRAFARLFLQFGVKFSHPGRRPACGKHCTKKPNNRQHFVFAARYPKEPISSTHTPRISFFKIARYGARNRPGPVGQTLSYGQHAVPRNCQPRASIKTVPEKIHYHSSIQEIELV